MKEVLVSVMRSTLQIATYEDVVGEYFAAGYFVWLKEKKRCRGGAFCVQVMMFFQDVDT
jgi:hypothetical protein